MPKKREYPNGFVINKSDPPQRYFSDWLPSGPLPFGSFTQYAEFRGYMLSMPDGTAMIFE